MSEEESREEKNKRVEEIMNNMRLKNQQYLQRHEEVEKDRIEAEKQGSAITSTIPKVNKQNKKSSNIPQIRQEREWDQGKTTEGDWSNFRSQGAYGRAPRASDSNWRRQDDSDKKYNPRSNFDSRQRAQNEATSRAIQEPKQSGNTFHRSRGFNRRSDSFPQNWRSEQKRNVNTEDPTKIVKENDKIWRDEEDNDEVRNKQKRVVKWLDTLKDVQHWETENPINVYEDNKDDKGVQDKPQSSWDDQIAEEEDRISKKQVTHESKVTASGSTDTKWESDSHKLKSRHGEHSTNVRDSEYCNKTKFDRMLMAKKNYASIDLSRPGIKRHTYQGKSEQKLHSEENASEKQKKRDYFEPDFCTDNEEKSNRKGRSSYEEEDNDNQYNISVMQVSGKWSDQRPNYSRGRGRGRGFSSNWNVDKSQRNVERRQVGARPATIRKTDSHCNINQGKLPSRSNYKANLPKKTGQVRKNEAARSDEEEDLQLEHRKPYQKERSKNYRDNNKAKKIAEERESEGIWSDLDTEETRLNYERYLKEGKKCPRIKNCGDKSEKVFQKESDEISSDQEAEAAEFSENAYKVKYSAKNNMHKGMTRTENTEEIIENIVNLSKDMKKKEDILKGNADQHKHQSNISDVDSYAMFSSQLDKRISERPFCADITEEKDLETTCDKEFALKKSDIEFVKDTLKTIKIDLLAQLTSTPTQVPEKINTEEYSNVENIQNIDEAKYIMAKSKMSTATSYIDIGSDENIKLQQSSSKISSHVVSIDNTTYIVKEPKIIRSQPAKSPEITRKINQTYTIEKPTIIPAQPIDKEELLPKSKNSPEKSTSALKGSTKDYKGDEKDF